MTFCAGVHLISARCMTCNATRLSRMTPELAERWYQGGYYSQDEYEAYMHVWATSATRHTAGGWTTAPDTESVRAWADAIRTAAGLA